MSNFTPLEALHFNRNLTTDLKSVVERVLSKSYISILDEEKKAEIESDIKNLLGGGDDQNLGRVWIDKEKGTWEYVSHVKRRKGRKGGGRRWPQAQLIL